MGRHIRCKFSSNTEKNNRYGYEHVWKYRLGSQPSEMHRIYDELGIGKYALKSDANEDVLVLNRSDIEKLEKEIDRLKDNSSNFLDMIKAIRDFMFRYPERNEFILEGEL